MLIFKFDNSDLSELDKRFHDSFEFRFDEAVGDTLEDYVEKFKYFLLAFGFSQQQINQITVDDPKVLDNEFHNNNEMDFYKENIMLEEEDDYED